MSTRDLVPELHDVGKLVDADGIAASILGWPGRWKHTFTSSSDAPIDLRSFGLPQPANPTWYGLLNHHPERLSDGARLSDPKVRAWRGDPNVMQIAPQLMLLRVADHLASSTSRALARDVEAGMSLPRIPSHGRVCLWRAAQEPDPKLVQTKQDLSDLLTIVAKEDLGTFRQNYGSLLRRIPEDRGFPRPVTTLWTHVRLVGQYFRTLRRYSREVSERGKRFLEYAGERSEMVREIEERWTFRMVRCRLRIPAAPARLRDLGVFQRLEELLEDLQHDSSFADCVVFSTFDGVWLFLPREEILPLSNVMQRILDAAFDIDARVREGPLTALMEGQRPEEPLYLQRRLPEQINPPLCEVCERAHGDLWHRRVDDVPEYLCNICAETRDRFSHRFERLEEWDAGHAAWVRVTLHADRLDKHFRGLFGRFLQDRAAPDEMVRQRLAEALRITALAADYVDDYVAMAAEFTDRLRDTFGADRVESPIANRRELMILRLERLSEAVRILQLFHQVVLRHFPGSVEDPPFGLAVSVAPVRFPFLEQWRLLQAAHQPAEVHLVGTGRIALSLSALPRLVLLAEDRGAPRRGLHRLADLAAISQQLAQVAIRDREERDLGGIASRLHEVGVDFEGMHTFAGLMRDRR